MWTSLIPTQSTEHCCSDLWWKSAKVDVCSVLDDGAWVFEVGTLLLADVLVCSIVTLVLCWFQAEIKKQPMTARLDEKLQQTMTLTAKRLDIRQQVRRSHCLFSIVCVVIKPFFHASIEQVFSFSPQKIYRIIWLFRLHSPLEKLSLPTKAADIWLECWSNLAGVWPVVLFAIECSNIFPCRQNGGWRARRLQGKATAEPRSVLVLFSCFMLN